MKQKRPKFLKNLKHLTKVKLRIHLKAIPQYILVLSVLSATAWITGKYLEAGCFAISYCWLRYLFTNILHCGTTFKCMLLTNSIIIIFVPIIIPITNSLFGGLISGFTVNYIANLIASNIFREQEKQELQRLRAEIYCRNVYKMSEPDLRAYCKEHGLDSIDEEIVIQRLIYHLKGQELYDKIGYSKPQMIRQEKRIETKLNIKLKDR